MFCVWPCCLHGSVEYITQIAAQSYLTAVLVAYLHVASTMVLQVVTMSGESRLLRLSGKLSVNGVKTKLSSIIAAQRCSMRLFIGEGEWLDQMLTLRQALAGKPRMIQLVMSLPQCECCGGLTTQRCGSCRLAFYCSKLCQQADRAVHKATCHGPAAKP